MKKVSTMVALVIFSLVSVVVAANLTGSTFGDATSLGGGTYKLVSDTTSGAGFGGVDFNTPTSFSFSSIEYLGTKQVADPGDTCTGGSPRYQLNVDTNGDGVSDGNVFVYTYDLVTNICPADTGDLTGGPLGDVIGTYDLSQIGGSGYTNYAGALAFFAANPTYSIIGIQLVVDAGYAQTDQRQVVTVTPQVSLNFPEATTASACKNGGYLFTQRADGSTFKNQGACVSYTQTRK